MEKKRILVVDDDDMICNQVRRILSDKYDIVMADSGDSAIELYEKTQPDMILSDLMMPKMSGFEMMDELRQEHGAGVPVMFMTGQESDESEEKSLTIGAVDYIRKPFKADVLIKRIDNIMSNIDKISGLTRAAENDPMTGVLNKMTSAERIGDAIRTGQGIFMMIDIDSFKLVNDIYGHEKGDEILIRFAGLLKSIVRSSDIVGRMGGDEFVAYIHNTKDEAMLAQRTEFLNNRLYELAKECLSEDMNIPIGCSIGAAICPDDGRDFLGLYKKADQALYNVKSNGKHGYSIFKKGSQEKEEKENGDYSELRMILGEREGRGAYVLPLEMFKGIYRFLMRVQKNYAWDIQLVVSTFECDFGSVNDYIERFLEVEASCLRASDVIARYGENQIVTILLKNLPGDSQIPIDRVMKKWNEMPESKEVRITHHHESLSIL